MFKKKDQGGKFRRPGDAYRNFKGSDANLIFTWEHFQRQFKKRKRKRRISRLMRKGQHPKRTMRPLIKD